MSERGETFEVSLRLSSSRSAASGVKGWILHDASPEGLFAFLGRLAEGAGIEWSCLRPYRLREPVQTQVSPSGWLVPLADAAGEALPASFVERLVAEYGGRAEPLCRCGSVLLPLGASLWPPLREDEIDSLFPLPVELLHPRYGRAAFETHEAVEFADLVTVAAPRSGDLSGGDLLACEWDRALQGTRLPESIGPVLARVQEGDLRDFIAEFDGVVGLGEDESLPDEAFEGGESPRRPGEQGKTSRERPGRVKRWLARRARAYASRAPRTASSETWIDRLEHWAARVLDGTGSHGVGSDRQGAGGSLAQWLLDRLREDPDAGLRYAVPLDNDRWGGSSGPSGRLRQRDPDFDLADVGVQRGASLFGANQQQLLELEAIYRQEALRHAQAGDHRRAAFIYAHLLGDLRTAATLLEQGGFVREAAALWSERLRQPREAARCLIAGGMVSEGVRIYDESGAFAEAARALAEAGRSEEAAVRWERALEQSLAEGGVLRAAKIAEDELGDAARAAEILFEGWTRYRQHPDRIAAWIRVQDRRGAVHEVQAWAEDEGRDGLQAALAVEGPEPAFREIASAVPRIASAELREDLGDALRVGAARVLAGPALQGDVVTSRTMKLGVLHALRGLAPDDAIWSRDLTHLRGAIPAEAERAPSVYRSGLAEIRIGRQFQWMSAPGLDGPYALAQVAGSYVRAQLVLATRTLLLEAVDEGGQAQSRVAWTAVPDQVRSVQFVGAPGLDRTLHLLGIYGSRSVLRLVPKALAFGTGDSWTVGSAPWWQDDMISANAQDGGQWVAVENRSAKVLMRFATLGEAGNVVREHMMSEVDVRDGLFIGRLGRDACVVSGGVVHFTRRGRVPQDLELGEDILGVEASPASTWGRLLVRTSTRVLLVTLRDPATGSSLLHLRTLVRGDQPCAAFLDTGAIVCTGDESHHVYRTSQNELIELARRDRARGEASAVNILSTPLRDGYAVLDETGRLTSYRWGPG